MGVLGCEFAKVFLNHFKIHVLLNHLNFVSFSDVTELQLNMTDGDPLTSSSVQLCRQHDLLSAHAVNIRLSDLSSQTSLVKDPPSSLGFALLGLVGIFLSDLKAV